MQDSPVGYSRVLRPGSSELVAVEDEVELDDPSTDDGEAEDGVGPVERADHETRPRR